MAVRQADAGGDAGAVRSIRVLEVVRSSTSDLALIQTGYLGFKFRKVALRTVGTVKCGFARGGQSSDFFFTRRNATANRIHFASETD